jgi:hypothetical protein
MKLIPFLMLVTILAGLLAGCAASVDETGGYSPSGDRPGLLYFYTDG